MSGGRGLPSSHSSPTSFRHTVTGTPRGLGLTSMPVPGTVLPLPCGVAILLRAGHPGPLQVPTPRTELVAPLGRKVTLWFGPPGTSGCSSPAVSRLSPHRWGLPGAVASLEPLPPPQAPPHLRVLRACVCPASSLGGPQTHFGVAIAILLGSIGWCLVSNTAW